MDKPRHQQQLGYGNNETVAQAGSTSAHFRPPNPNSSDVKPVHNYSIQTGEEFSLEFMRDRVIPQRSSILNGASDTNTTGYMEFRDLLGISHTGSDCASDVSRFSVAENGLRDYDRTNPSLHEFGNKLGHVQSAPQALISKDTSLETSSAYGSVTAKVKILCSFGGKILPRPGDSKLRYVGGETHLISVRKDISWLALKQKILEIYYQTHVVKYQLPGEDLDALVSVSCEEDLQNMFEEYYEMESRGGSQKIRMFLFSINALEDDALLGVNRNDGESEFQYVVAVNGMDIGPGRNSILHGRDSSSANNLAALDGRNNEEINGDVVGVSAPQLMVDGFQQSAGQPSESIPPISSLHYSHSIPPSAAYQLQQPVPPSSALHYSQSIPPTSSIQYPQSITTGSDSTYGMFPQYYGHVVQHGERERFPSYTHNPNYSGMAETTGSIPFQGHVNQQGGWGEGYLYPGTTPQSTQAIVEEQKVSPDTKVHEHAETENRKTLAKDYQIPPQLDDVEVKNHNQVREVSAATTTPSQEAHLLPPRGDTRQNTPAKPAPTYRDAVIARQVLPSGNEDQLSTSSGTCGPVHNHSESNLIDLNYPEPVQPPPRVYRSERIPRDQLESLNRLSKSDDLLGSQFLMSQSQTSNAQQDGAKEAVGKSHEDSQTVNGDATHQKHKNVETIFGKVGLSDDTLDSEPLRKIADPDDANKNRVVNGTHTEIDVSNSSNVNADMVYVIPEEQASTRRSDSLQGEILIDINDRFPRDFLSEIFSKAVSEVTSSVHPYPNDRAAVSMDVQNHDPKNWSYFQQLAEQQFIQRDTATIEQADSHFPSEIKDGGESSRLHHVTPLSRDGNNIADPQLTLGRDYGDDFSERNAGGTSTILPTPEDDQMKVTESEEFGAMVENLRMPDSEPKDEKTETRHAALPPLKSVSDFDGLQIIKNEDLEELKELGSGTFGTVYHGKWRGSDVAIKRIKKSCFAGRSSEQERLTGEFWGEADILSKLHHPNVVAFYGVVKDGPGGTLATVRVHG